MVYSRSASHACVFLVAVVWAFVAGAGCMTLTTFNTPRTMQQGAGAFGAGVGGLVDDDESGNGVDIAPLPSAFGRVGLTNRLEAGVKVAPYVFFADLKYQLVDRKIDLAVDLGGSYGFPNTGALYPALYVGTDRVYLGGRLAILSGTIESDDDNAYLDGVAFSETVPGVVAGASIGGRVRVMPELNVHFSTDDGTPLFLPGLGIQYRLGGGR